MKQCPACRTTYTDDSLSFCLADGAVLTTTGGGEEEETVVYRERAHQMKVDIPQDEFETRVAQPRQTVEHPSSSSPILKILLVVLLLGFLVIVGAGVLGVAVYFGTGPGNENVVVKSPTPSPKPTAGDEMEKLKEELANLQKRLDEQKKPSVNTIPFPTPGQSYPTARVNSPGDGFLALRSIPDHRYGERLAKIPHGTVIELNSCANNTVTIDGRSGRWCLTTYRGVAGWVFDGWLSY